MVHPLVTQLWFARSEFVRGLEGVSPEDAVRRLEPMNCMSWIVGHLASQENFLWVKIAQDIDLAPDLYKVVGYGRPTTTPPWEEMWARWREITETADQYLTTITPQTLHTHFTWQGKQLSEDVGTTLLRNIYHYWFHLGEAYAIRQMLGHTDLPEFVGGMSEVRHSRGE
jgi:hypothetical protein